MVKPIIDRRLRILLGLLAIAASVLPALACGGRGGGDVRPDKQKTIVSNTPDGYEPAVARQLAHWSGRWQILQYAFMSRAGNTTTIDSAEMDYFAFLAEHTGGSDPAMRPSNAGYLLIPYRYGTPSYDTADNGDFHDFGDETWTFADSSSGLDALTSANLVLAEVELARIYHTPSVFGDPETHDFGATQRLHGLLLVEIAKRQAMHFINNRNSYEVTPEGQLRMIAALGALIRVLRQPTFNGTDNRYRDVNFSGQLLAWMDFFFDEYTDSPAPATANGLCDAIVNLGYYVTNTLDSSLRTQATSLIENYADALADYQTTDPVEQASRIRGLAEAGRLTFDQTRYSRITEAFQSLKNDYRPQTGVFEGRQNLTAYEVGRIVGALNAATELAAAFIDTDWAQLIMSDFIAASLYLGGMYRSTYPPSVLSDYEQPQNPLYYTFPGLPFNRDTGGFGTAPSFASRIAQKENAEGWEVENASFDAVGALSLSIELLSLQPSKFYPWPAVAAAE
ncbi:MAG: hypothetical protein U5N86_01960 [Planctomycetota bacterium]|nr:hypothetical protein [Planctomycetota bacterium]